MKRFAMSCFFVLSVASLAFAQTQPAPKPEAKPEPKPATAALPSVDQILDKYVQALGGKAALEKQTSRFSKGTFEIPAMGANGTFQSFEKAPNLSATVVEIPGFGAINSVFDGKNGWSKDPMQGVREQTGAELVMVKINSEFHSATKMKDLYKKLEVKGKDKVGAAEVYVVEATPSEGGPVKMSFDAATGLLVRQEMETESPLGKLPTEILIEDYRVVDGVKLPFVLKTNTPAFSSLIKLEEVKHNVAIDDAKFSKPSAQ